MESAESLVGEPDQAGGQPPTGHFELSAVLRVYPIAAAAAFLAGYVYQLSFLYRFGISPEAIGVSQLELVTRTALLAVVEYAAFYGFLVVCSLLILPIAPPISAMHGTLNRLQAYRSMCGSIRRAIRSVALIRNFNRAMARTATQLEWRTMVVTSEVAIILVLIGFSFLSVHVNPILVLLLAGLASFVVTAACGYALQESTKWTPVRVLLSTTVVGFVLVLAAATAGGGNAATQLKAGKRLPLAARLTGLDVRQVRVTWAAAVPKPRSGLPEDMYLLGADGPITYLFDCNGAEVYHVPTSEVVLSDAPHDSKSSLECKSPRSP